MMSDQNPLEGTTLADNAASDDTTWEHMWTSQLKQAVVKVYVLFLR